MSSFYWIYGVCFCILRTYVLSMLQFTSIGLVFFNSLTLTYLTYAVRAVCVQYAHSVSWPDGVTGT